MSLLRPATLAAIDSARSNTHIALAMEAAYMRDVILA
jgi:hypothetical protein